MIHWCRTGDHGVTGDAYSISNQDAIVLIHDRRIPDTAACFPWNDGSTAILEEGFDNAIDSAGAVLVSRTGNMDAISAYGYSYEINFVGSAVRGDMDLRLLTGREAMDDEAYVSGGSEVVFNGLGDKSSLNVTLASNLDSVTFTDAMVEFT